MVGDWDNERQKVMKSAWETFIKKGTIDRNVVRPVIAESWIRSKEYGVDPTEDLSFKELYDISESFDITERLKKSSALVNAAREPIAALTQMVKGSGFRINLTDSEGFFLISEGDEAVLERTNLLNRHIGVCRNEQVAGTCGISLVLVEDTPIQVNSFEHYNQHLHDWTCSSAPIHDQQKKIVGVLNISGHYTLVHQHTLGMVVGLARAIDLAFTNQNTIKKLHRFGEISNMILQETYEGVIIFDNEGKICLSNRMGIDILASLTGNRFITNFRSLKKANDLFGVNREIVDKEISTVIGRKRKFFYMTMRKIADVEKKDIYNCIFFKDIEKIQRITQKIHGQQAFYTFSDIIGENELLRKAVEEAKLAAKESSPVLIIGKTGTGKEMFAQAVHNHSSRKSAPFIAINCGAIPADLIESELFGYDAGSFTGARKGGKPGKIEMADGGTLFLDELDSMPLNMQTKLLRVLQTGMVNRIGSERLIPVDIRLISASKTDLIDEIENGIIRDDLFFRVNTITIQLPSLSERRSDISLLCGFFLKRLTSRSEKPIRGIDSEVYGIFETYSWPGNVRELESCIERAFVFETGEVISTGSIPSYIRKKIDNTHGIRTTIAEKTMQDYEYSILEKTLIENNGNISKSARILGIGRDTLYRKLRKYSIKR
ncbi:MAG: sigma-54-dependent Fis family transcriptional regulator [Spirochaetes bacterium]|nr:sigma-54-dependent Fis family transcriptional regulator [Spirochaetota bacterium]